MPCLQTKPDRTLMCMPLPILTQMVWSWPQSYHSPQHLTNYPLSSGASKWRIWWNSPNWFTKQHAHKFQDRNFRDAHTDRQPKNIIAPAPNNGGGTRSEDASKHCRLTGAPAFGGCTAPLSASPEAFDARGSIVLLATLSGRFFFSFASIDDSRSGNGGISSRIVAYINMKYTQDMHILSMT